MAVLRCARAGPKRAYATAAKLRPFLLERFEGWNGFNDGGSLSSSECEPFTLAEVLEDVWAHTRSKEMLAPRGSLVLAC